MSPNSARSTSHTSRSITVRLQHVVLRPVQVMTVGRHLLCTGEEYREVRVGQLGVVGEATRHRDVVLGKLVADATRSRMQHHPRVVVAVQTNLHEVVAAAECAHLAQCLVGARLHHRREVVEHLPERGPVVRIIVGERRFSVLGEPDGTTASRRVRSRRSESGRSFAVSDVRTAAMPHPMSTPTAAGDTASRSAITDPTVAPLPKCTSGITATCLTTHGSAAKGFSALLAR